jgi:type II secretory pathway pseudopilin PulG
MFKTKHKKGFSLIETIFSIGILLIIVMVLVAMLGPILSSLDDAKELDEIPSIVESLNSFLQADSSLAVDGSSFDLIYEAVKSSGYATIYVFRSYSSNDSTDIQLSIGFSPKERTPSLQINKSAKVYNFRNSAGPIYRAIITNGPQIPKQYYRDRGRSAKPRYYLTANSDNFKSNYLPLQISIYVNAHGPAFIENIPLKEILQEDPIFSYSTIINR